MQVFYKEQQHHFRLLNDVDVATSISLAHEFKTPYLAMSEAGHLKIKAGYRWSLPWYVYSHSPEWIKAVLVHDALYELIRNYSAINCPNNNQNMGLVNLSS